MMLFHSASVHFIGLGGLNCLINLAWLGLINSAWLCFAGCAFLISGLGWLLFFRLLFTWIQFPSSSSATWGGTGPLERVMYPCPDVETPGEGTLAGGSRFCCSAGSGSETASSVGNNCGWKRGSPEVEVRRGRVVVLTGGICGGSSSCGGS